MERYKEFLSKLSKLSEETGVHIEGFGDEAYSPTLQIEGEEDSGISISWWDSDNKCYLAKTGNDPYSGEILKYVGFKGEAE